MVNVILFHNDLEELSRTYIYLYFSILTSVLVSAGRKTGNRQLSVKQRLVILGCGRVVCVYNRYVHSCTKVVERVVDDGSDGDWTRGQCSQFTQFGSEQCE